jgi:hypothetical protein
MAAFGRIRVTDREGWEREFPVTKRLIYIGSDPRNDVVLQAAHGGGVAPRHLQLVFAQGEPPKCRVINLGGTDVLFSPRPGRAGGDGRDQASAAEGNAAGEGGLLRPRSALDVQDGDILKMGDFRLVLGIEAAGDWAVESGPVGTPVEQQVATPSGAGAPVGRGVEVSDRASEVIGLKLFLPQTSLHPGQTVEGTVTVHNLGDQAGVQFRLEVEGLEADCYTIGPGPILFPNAARDVLLRLRHPMTPDPRAGKRRISIRALAPDAYPGQSAVVSQVLDIAPFYRHKLRFLVPDEVERQTDQA